MERAVRDQGVRKRKQRKRVMGKGLERRLGEGSKVKGHEKGSGVRS